MTFLSSTRFAYGLHTRWLECQERRANTNTRTDRLPLAARIRKNFFINGFTMWSFSPLTLNDQLYPQLNALYMREYTSANDWRLRGRWQRRKHDVLALLADCLIKASTIDDVRCWRRTHFDTAGCSGRLFFRRPFPDTKLSHRLKVGKTCIILLFLSLSDVKFICYFNNACPSCGYKVQ